MVLFTVKYFRNVAVKSYNLGSRETEQHYQRSYFDQIFIYPQIRAFGGHHIFGSDKRRVRQIEQGQKGNTPNSGNA
jgi:hypothetical protein